MAEHKTPDALTTPRYVTCACTLCGGKIEFDAGGFEKGETRTVPCPHCGVETMLFVTPLRIPPVIPVPKGKSGGWKWILLALAVAIVAFAAVKRFTAVEWSKEPTVRHGDIEVRVRNAKIGQVCYRDELGRPQFTKSYLTITLSIANLGRS